ncbi:hypothetical protein GMMP15_550010 [Candidatus Magnetomoraceae bacterium gMMP-15]
MPIQPISQVNSIQSLTSYQNLQNQNKTTDIYDNKQIITQQNAANNIASENSGALTPIPPVVLDIFDPEEFNVYNNEVKMIAADQQNTTADETIQNQANTRLAVRDMETIIAERMNPTNTQAVAKDIKIASMIDEERNQTGEPAGIPMVLNTYNTQDFNVYQPVGMKQNIREEEFSAFANQAGDQLSRRQMVFSDAGTNQQFLDSTLQQGRNTLTMDAVETDQYYEMSDRLIRATQEQESRELYQVQLREQEQITVNIQQTAQEIIENNANLTQNRSNDSTTMTINLLA